MGQFEETNRVANELDPARSHGPLRRVLLAGLVIAFSIGEGAVDANDPQGNPVKAFSSLCVESANGQPGEAVVVNIANTDVVAAGYGSLRSSDDTPVHELPEKEKYSSVNFAPNESVNPNLNIIEVSADGKICYDQGPSKNNVILDEFGVFAAGIFSGEPVRIEDTRENEPQAVTVKAFSSLCVESANGLPGEAVVVNIANAGVVAAGYGSLRSSDDTPVYELPEKEKYSSVNFAPNESVNPNLNIIEVGADGKICYDQGPSKNNVILDEFGVFAAGIFKGEPVRIEDTRENEPQAVTVKAFSSLCVESANGLPGEAVVVNIANAGVVAAGYGSLRSSDDTPVYELPEKEKYSSVNFAPNESVNPNLNIIEVGADGEICYDQGPSKNNVILDEFGVFAAGIFKGEPVRIEDTRIIGDFYPIPIDQIVYGVNDPCTVWFPGTSIYFVFDYNRDNLFDSTRGSEYGCF
jgi:hypothetical protein